MARAFTHPHWFWSCPVSFCCWYSMCTIGAGCAVTFCYLIPVALFGLISYFLSLSLCLRLPVLFASSPAGLVRLFRQPHGGLLLSPGFADCFTSTFPSALAVTLGLLSAFPCCCISVFMIASLPRSWRLAGSRFHICSSPMPARVLGVCAES